MNLLQPYPHFHGDAYDRLCAFNLYWSQGYETATSVYPEQAAFILVHMDKTPEEIYRACYTEEYMSEEY